MADSFAFLAVVGVLVAFGDLPAAAASCGSGVRGDVNGDGYAEVVIGEPGDSNDRGAVHLLYGHKRGLVVKASGTALDDQYFTEDTSGVPGVSEVGDRFGASSELGDFNGDGCADLAVGAPGEDQLTGIVMLLYGSSRGITTTGAHSYTITDLFGAAESSAGQIFGSVLTVGDLNDDSITDLAIGAPEKQVSNIPAAGGVVVLFGDSDGLNQGSAPATLLTQDTTGMPDSAEQDDYFGASVTTGDFNGDGISELAIGVPGQSAPPPDTEAYSSGSVQVIESGPAGFRPADAVTLSPNSPGVPGESDQLDAFGSAVVAGDVTGDGRADLAVGEPGYHTSEYFFGSGEGAVYLIPGSPTGLTGLGSQRWTKDSPGVEGAPTEESEFGRYLAIGPLDKGKYADLAVGATGDYVGSHGTGSVTILRGSPSGLTTIGSGGRRLHPGVRGIAGSVKHAGAFGTGLAVAFVQGGSRGNLIIGEPYARVRGIRAGRIHQLAITKSGPNPIGSSNFHLDTHGLKGTPAKRDFFGYTVH